MPRNRTEPEYRQVYFIQAERLGMVKIGSADDSRKRLATMQVGSPDRLTLRGVFHVDDAVAWEKHLHKHFAHLRRHGEWFEPDEAMTEYMTLLAEPEQDVVKVCLKPQPDPGAPRYSCRAKPGESGVQLLRRLYREMKAAGIPA